MENANKKRKAAYEAAEKEGRVTTQNLLQEIEPLLREYFISENVLKSGCIEIYLPNGQTFYITVKEK